jgi:hypothetical protein
VTLSSDRLELGRDHVVQFYDSDDDLAERVARYLGGAIEAGGAGIVIATEAHRHAFEERMAAGGIDVAAAWSSGALLVHDASEAMRTLIDDRGRPAPEAFDRLIGNLVRYAARRGGPVRAYGEIVALLLHAGNTDGALDLERLWNGLQREAPFSLFCAYPMASVVEAGDVDTFRQICSLHTDVRIDATESAVR